MPFFMLRPDGVPLRTGRAAPLTPARGPALPALCRPVAVWPLGVPGPRDECRASPLEGLGRLLSEVLRRGALCGAPPAGPAEVSRAPRFMIMVAAGETGAEEEATTFEVV